MPTYKRPLFLKRAINSILLQDYQNVEVLVVDDNNDGDQFRIETELVMQSYIGNAKVKYYKHHQNSNGSAARNTGIQNAEGDYIVFLDDDDYLLPERIKKAVNFLDSSSPDIGGCCVNYLKKYKKLIYKESNYNCITKDCSGLLDGSIDYAAGSTLMLKKEVIDIIHGFNPSYKRHQDWEFIIRVLQKYKIASIPFVGVVISADGIRNNPNTQLLIEMKDKIFNEFESIIEQFSQPIQKRISIKQQSEVLYSYLRGRNFRNAVTYYKQSSLDSSILINEAPHIMLSCITSIWPSFMIAVYWLYNYKYRKYKKLINNLERLYNDYSPT